MNNAALFGVVMGDSVIMVCNFFSAPISGSGNGGFAFAARDYFDAAMIYRHSVALLSSLFKNEKAATGIRIVGY